MNHMHRQQLAAALQTTSRPSQGPIDCQSHRHPYCLPGGQTSAEPLQSPFPPSTGQEPSVKLQGDVDQQPPALPSQACTAELGAAPSPVEPILPEEVTSTDHVRPFPAEPSMVAPALPRVCVKPPQRKSARSPQSFLWLGVGIRRPLGSWQLPVERAFAIPAEPTTGARTQRRWCARQPCHRQHSRNRHSSDRHQHFPAVDPGSKRQSHRPNQRESFLVDAHRRLHERVPAPTRDQRHGPNAT